MRANSSIDDRYFCNSLITLNEAQAHECMASEKSANEKSVKIRRN